MKCFAWKIRLEIVPCDLVNVTENCGFKVSLFGCGLQQDTTERKFLHHLAGNLGLSSTSRGKGDKRYITVTKKAAKKSAGTELDELPQLILNPKSVEPLNAHMTAFPIKDEERDLILLPTEASQVMHHDGSKGGFSKKQVKSMKVS